MSNLFPVFKSTEEDPEDNKVTSSWLTIGSSFDDIALKKSKSNKAGSSFNQSDSANENRPKPNTNQRKTASELNAMDSDSSSEAEKKKKKKHKKKKDKKKLAVYDPKLDQLDELIGDEEYAHIDEAVELYMPKKNELSHDTKFLFKHVIRKDLLPVSILYFGEKENYEYGAPQIKDVPLFRRIKKNMILGLKSDRNTLAIIDDLNRIQGINRSLIPNANDEISKRRYFNTAFASDEFFDIQREENVDKNLLNLDFIIIEKKSTMDDEDDDMQDFRLRREEMTSKEADLLERTKDYNKRLESNPEDVLLWIEFINFQDKHHLGLVGKSNSSLVEKKLAILEKAMSNPKVGKNPLMILYHLRLLHQSSKSDDFYKVLHSTWEKYLDENSTNVVFWVLFTDFKYSYFSRYKTLYMRDSFAESLTKIQEMMSACGNTKDIAIFKQLQLYLIRKLCYFEKMSGYYERAFGIFQSLLEINLFPPPSLTYVYNKDKKLQNYQNYYESYEDPKVGELLVHRGWIDSETKKAEMKAEFKEKFIGLFETKLEPFAKSKEEEFDSFVKENIFFLPNELQEHTNKLLEWLVGEFSSMKCWRPANNAYDKTRIEESADAIVLYDDIQNYMIFVNQDSFKIELINSLLQLLDLPPVFSGTFLGLSSSVVSFIYNKKLGYDFETISEGKFEPGRGTEQILGVDMNDLFFRYPRIDFVVNLCLRDTQYLSRIEYARRLLGHLSTVIPDCNQILAYIFFIEIVYSRLADKIQIEEVKESKKRMKNMLKANEKNIFLWIMYAENVGNKDKKPEEVVKIFENLLKFITSKKQTLILYYFYISYYINTELHDISKPSLGKIQKLLMRLVCFLEKKQFKDVNEVSMADLMQMNKILKNHTAQCLLSTESKSKKFNLYNLNKLLPLTKSAILIYLTSVCSILFMDQDIDEGMKEFRNNCVVLEKQIKEKIKNTTELEKLEAIKKNHQDIQELCSVLLYRILIYKKHSNTYLNPQIIKKYILELCKQHGSNMLINAEAIKSIYSSSFRSNQMFKIKTELQIKFLDTPFWYLIISAELAIYNGEDKENLVNILRTYFQAFNSEESLYDHLFFEMEKKYSKFKESLSWDDHNYLNENHLYTSNLFGELYLKFISLFFPDSLKREALIILHRFPFSKDKYLNYFLSSLSDNEEIKRVFTMLTEKEIRMYREFSF